MTSNEKINILLAKIQTRAEVQKILFEICPGEILVRATECVQKLNQKDLERIQNLEQKNEINIKPS